jgi:putative ABC transport system permease protein
VNLTRLVTRSLAYYWKTGIAIVFGFAVATGVITGSLVIGDSVTGSLRDTALSRLGTIDYALVSPRHFRVQLADELLKHPEASMVISNISTVLSTRGAASNPATSVTIPDVDVLGVDDDFWQFYAEQQPPPLSGRECALNAALARDLDLSAGDDLLLTAHKQSPISTDTLFAWRGRQDTAPSMRLRVKSILPAGDAGDFRLDAESKTPRNIFVSREWSARRLDKDGLANVLLVTSRGEAADRAGDALASALASSCTLSDHGLALRRGTEQGYYSLTSEATVLTDAQVEAAKQAAQDSHSEAAITSVYLATTMSKVHPANAPELAYAMVAAIEQPQSFVFHEGSGDAPGDDEIWLNEWAAEDLNAHVGESVRLTYMMPTEDGTYPTADVELKVRAIVEMEAAGADAGLVPDFEGITDAGNVDDWEPPFPVDLSRITDRDEEYWDKYRASPKAFVGFSTARTMWQSAPGGDSAGWVTSVRVQPMPVCEVSFDGVGPWFTKELLRHLSPQEAGLVFRPVRELALQAAQGTSDFGQLFLGLSMFLVLSGAALGAMLLRLLVDGRASEAGLMLATGCPAGLVRRALLAEGTILTLLGTLLGVPGGLLYAAGIIHALGSWWSDALGTTPHLWLHVAPQSIAIGTAAGLIIGLLAVAWSSRKLGRVGVVELLYGWQAMAVSPARTRTRPAVILLVALALATALIAVLSMYNDVLPPEVAFFVMGALLLLGGLTMSYLALVHLLRRRGATSSLLRLSLRNIAAATSRSLLVIGLLAGATFVIVAVAANTRDLSHMDYRRRDAGTGGFALQALSSVPLSFDLGTPTGRANLGFTPADEQVLEGVETISFLVSPGQDISCLNIARPTYPRILGVPDAMIQRGGFRLLRATDDRAPGWEALRASLADGHIPAFGDADSVKWTLHSEPGKTYTIPGPDGQPIDLVFSGLLGGSIFAGELLIWEHHFRERYPTVAAPSYFLIDTPPGREEQVAAVLRKKLGEMGLQVRPTREVLNDFMQVQNTYMSMFLALGSLGLLLGTVGLVAVLLRSALERTGELALMLAIGFYRPRLARLLMVENVGLLAAGLMAGTVSALVAVAPQLASAQSQVNWVVITGIFVGILLFGIVTCSLAVHFVLRGSLIPALRQE